MYEDYYGLKSKPFQLTPDPGFFFASKLHKRAMSYLQYGLSQAEGFIVITGDIGTGKTTIANSLLDSLEEDIFAAQIVTPKLSPDEIVKMVASKFELDVAGKSKAEILDDLERFLNQLAAQGKRALLLVDEAQNLPLETIEELRMLSNFQKAGKRIVASCHLAPLNSQEAREYIEFRLQHAGYVGEGLFSDESFAAIHHFSRGVPRRMNTLLDRILLYGFLEEIEFFQEHEVNLVIDEVKSEMFIPDNLIAVKDEVFTTDPDTIRFTAKGTEIHESQYYKDMLHELVDALDDALKHKIKLTQYIDKLLKKKYQTYARLKSDDE